MKKYGVILAVLAAIALIIWAFIVSFYWGMGALAVTVAACWGVAEFWIYEEATDDETYAGEGVALYAAARLCRAAGGVVLGLILILTLIVWAIQMLI